MSDDDASASGSSGGEISVALLFLDGALRERTRRALKSSAGIILVDDEQEADVILTDDIEMADRHSVLLSDDPSAGADLALDVSVLPSAADATLLRIAIEATRHGLVCSPSSASRNAAEPAEASDYGELTARESEVLRLMAAGASNKQIARELGVSVHTAKFHVASIMSKLEASSRTDAVARAMRLGLLMI